MMSLIRRYEMYLNIKENEMGRNITQGGRTYDLQKQFKKLLKKKKKKCTKIEGEASFGQIISLFRILDRNFNHADRKSVV